MDCKMRVMSLIFWATCTHSTEMVETAHQSSSARSLFGVGIPEKARPVVVATFNCAQQFHLLGGGRTKGGPPGCAGGSFAKAAGEQSRLPRVVPPTPRP